MATATKSNGNAHPRNKPNAGSKVPSKNVMATSEAAKASATSGKPDKVAYDAEQAKYKGEIDAVQVKMNAIKEKIALTPKEGPGADRRKALHAELDTLRDQQSTSKSSRGKILDQLKSIQENLSKKTKDLQAAKAKHPYKSTAEVDAHVKNLESLIETGSMKLAEEKRALQEISQAKRTRRMIENFQKEQQDIDDERARADGLRKQLDDPHSKAASERFDAIKAELDILKKEGDEAYAYRNKLFDERNSLKEELDALYSQKRESTQNYKDSTDRYWNKVNEDRARREERIRQQKAAEDEEKRKITAERLREEAAAPAFQNQIEDCQTLIDYFSAKLSHGGIVDVPPPALSTAQNQLTGIPELDIRQVEADPGLVARKKKSDGEGNYFVGTKGKKKGARPANGSGIQSPATSTQLNLPLGTLTALLEMSIPAPGSTSDVPRLIDDIKTKKAWFQANQARVTAEKVAKAESDIQRLLNRSQAVLKSNGAASSNGEAESLPEPSSTALEDGDVSSKENNSHLGNDAPDA